MLTKIRATVVFELLEALNWTALFGLKVGCL